MVKRGLGEKYEKAAFPRLRAYLDLTKPLATISSFLITGFGVLLAFTTSGVTIGIDQLYAAVFAGITIALIHAGSQAMNMAEDAEVDAKNHLKKNRPIPSGLVTDKEAHTIAWVLILVGLVRGFTITTSFGIICTIFAGMAILYNLPPLRIKDRHVGSLLWRAVSRGFLVTLAFWAVLDQPLHNVAVSLGVCAFLWVFSFQSVSDLPDIKWDREAGIRTLPAILGTQNTFAFMGASYLVSVAICFIITPFPAIPYLFLVVGAIILVWLIRAPMEASKITGMSPTWPLFYGGLGLLYLVPLILSL